MRNVLTYLFLITGVVVMLGCSGQPDRDVANNNSANPRSGQNQLDLGGGAGTNSTPANPARNNTTTNTSDNNLGGDLAIGDDSENSDAAEGEGEDIDAEEPAQPPPKPRVRRDRFGKPVDDLVIQGGGGGGGAAMMSDNGPTNRTPSGSDTSEDVASNDNNTPRTPDSNQPTTPEPVEEVKSFFDLAQEAFTKENEVDAFQYLYAHALTDKDALGKHRMNWYTGHDAIGKDPEAKPEFSFLEPRLALRWGAGVVYDVSGDFDGDPPVIGSSAADGSSSGSPNSPAAGGSGGLGIAGPPSNNRFNNSQNASGGTRNNRRDRSAKPPREELIYYTGDYGRFFLERLDMRRTHEGGFYGSLLADVDSNFEPEEAAEENTRNAPANVPDGNDDLQGISGGAGAVNNFGANNNGGRGNSSDDSDDDDGPKTSLQPGVTMVGVDKLSDLLSKAKSMGVDVLAVFEVDVKHTARSDKTTSATRLSLYSVKHGELILKGKNLTTTQVEKARERSSSEDNDPVEIALDLVFSDYADKQWRGAAFPKGMKKKHVDVRIGKLTSEKMDNPLPSLVEIRQYFVLEYIDKFEMANAFEALIGSASAKDLVDGSESKKRQALAKWMPGNFNAGPVDEGDFR